MYYKSLFCIIIAFILPQCSIQRPQSKKVIIHQMPLKKLNKAEIVKNSAIPALKDAPITIWIHGTRMSHHILPRFSYSKPGLNHYMQTSSDYYLRLIADTIISSDPNLFIAENFYLFGWTGKLSFEAREIAAHQLYKDLQILRQEFKNKYGKEPYIRIMSHSHGGNVALLLAKIKSQSDFDFAIHELVLLACPVQLKTKQLIKDDIFKKVYSFYSPLDFLQIADPQGIKNFQYPIFSQRLFDSDDKIMQWQIKINNRAFYHLDYILRRFLCNLASVIHQIDKCETNLQGINLACNHEKILKLTTHKKDLIA
jgi:hypothetical protein